MAEADRALLILPFINGSLAVCIGLHFVEIGFSAFHPIIRVIPVAFFFFRDVIDQRKIAVFTFAAIDIAAVRLTVITPVKADAFFSGCLQPWTVYLLRQTGVAPDGPGIPAIDLLALCHLVRLQPVVIGRIALSVLIRIG